MLPNTAYVVELDDKFRRKTKCKEANFDVTFAGTRAGIFKKSMGARHRGGIGFSYRPARLHRLAESFLGINSGAPYTFKSTGSAHTPRS
jgi:hypothetical protein